MQRNAEKPRKISNLTSTFRKQERRPDNFRTPSFVSCKRSTACETGLCPSTAVPEVDYIPSSDISHDFSKNRLPMLSDIKLYLEFLNSVRIFWIAWSSTSPLVVEVLRCPGRYFAGIAADCLLCRCCVRRNVVSPNSPTTGIRILRTSLRLVGRSFQAVFFSAFSISAFSLASEIVTAVHPC